MVLPEASVTVPAMTLSAEDKVNATVPSSAVPEDSLTKAPETTTCVGGCITKSGAGGGPEKGSSGIAGPTPTHQVPSESFRVIFCDEPVVTVFFLINLLALLANTSTVLPTGPVKFTVTVVKPAVDCRASETVVVPLPETCAGIGII